MGQVNGKMLEGLAEGLKQRGRELKQFGEGWRGREGGLNGVREG